MAIEILHDIDTIRLSNELSIYIGIDPCSTDSQAHFSSSCLIPING